jgi:hypothetical protein
LKYQIQFAVKTLGKKKGSFSEREFAKDSGVSRVVLRHLMARDQNINLKSIIKIANYLERDIHVLAISNDVNTDFSTVAIAYKVINDGPQSWKIHFMDLVDEFRRTLDPQLFLLAPPDKFPRQLRALLASIVLQLCEENAIDPPSWSRKMYFLEKPWFVSGMQSLKASALVESPLAFRRNNIFVHDNFLMRV